MKLAAFVLVCVLLGVQSAVISNPEAEVQRTAACVHRSGVSYDSLRRINSGYFEDDEKLKEYLWCVSRNAGFLDERGILQRDVIRDRLKGGRYNRDAIDEVMQQCTEQRETPQETAFQFMKCVYASTFPKRYS